MFGLKGTLDSTFTRLQLEVRDIVEVFLIPALAAVLPWPVCFAIFKRVARFDWLYRESCQSALTKARSLGWAGNEETHWIWVRRLVTLVDHADHYLGLTRSNAWMKRHLTVEGQWPQPKGAALLATFHWGAGYWGLRHAAQHGLKPHALVASLESPAYEGRMILTWYARSRNRNVATTLGAETIDIAHNLKKVIRTLRSNSALLGVLDVPADQAQASITLSVLGKPFTVAKGLLRLSVDEQVAITYYITGLNTTTGQRFLRIKEMPLGPSVEAQAHLMFAELDQLIQQDAPAWHFWSVSDRFFQ